MNEVDNSNPKRNSNTRTNRKHKKETKEKENGFVLDCLNQQKTHLQSYKSINDKFLKYYVIKIRPTCKKAVSPNKSIIKCQQVEEFNHYKFQEMLKK